MADNDYLHTAEILRTATPYTNGHTKQLLTMFASTMELFANLRSFRSNTLSMQSLQSEPVNMEGLLNALRPVLHEHERGLIDQILNIFNMKRMMSTYQEMMEMMQMMQSMNEQTSKPNTEEDNMFRAASVDNDLSYQYEQPLQQGQTETSFFDTNLNSNTDAESPKPSMNSNPQMMDMLKTMLSKEQAEMFENLSTMFQTQS